MATFVSLLRGINVGGKTMISMSALRDLLESLGLSDVKTLLQSGNVIFKSEGSAAALEKRLEAETKKRFERDVEFMIRTAAEWKSIVAANPCEREAKVDPSHLVVLFLKRKPEGAAVRALKEAIAGREYFEAKDRELYVVYPDGIGRSTLTNDVIDRKLGTSGTGRNWNTVQKIEAALER